MAATANATETAGCILLVIGVLTTAGSAALALPAADGATRRVTIGRRS